MLQKEQDFKTADENDEFISLRVYSACLIINAVCELESKYVKNIFHKTNSCRIRMHKVGEVNRCPSKTEGHADKVVA
jgi:hypothetical protein